MVVVKRPVSRVVAGGMLRAGTPVEDHVARWGLWVKREDLACLPPGPPFSKTRGVYARVSSRPESTIGVLDTFHSQAGHAVARACQVLGKVCVNYYPEYKRTPGHREPQEKARALGARLVGLPAGRSCILYHRARREVEESGGYMMPNALKLHESVEETAKEVPRGASYDVVVLPASSGTIAAGVIKGFASGGGPLPTFIVHLGYSRSHEEVRRYLTSASGVEGLDVDVVDEGYQYKDQARPGPTPEWPCNPYYDLKAFRWWLSEGRRRRYGKALFWNVG